MKDQTLDLIVKNLYILKGIADNVEPVTGHIKALEIRCQCISDNFIEGHYPDEQKLDDIMESFKTIRYYSPALPKRTLKRTIYQKALNSIERKIKDEIRSLKVST